MAKRLSIMIAALALSAMFAVPAAQADFGIKSWEALTCNTDNTIGGEPCKGDELPKLYRQAAGHPNFGITDFVLNQKGGFPNFPDGSAKDVRVELPVGLGVNPEATPKCSEAQLATSSCPPESKIGVDYIRTISPGPSPPLPPPGTEFTLPTPVYNVQAPFGVPSQAGFNATGTSPTLLVGELDPVDQHISFTISDLDPSVPLIGSRLVFNGRAGDGYLTMPSLCDGPQTTVLKLTSYPYPTGTDPEQQRTASYDTAVGVDGCADVPFAPTLDVAAEGARTTDSPEPATVEVGIPYEKGNPEGITNSELRTARVTLPEGMGLNPSAAEGLVPCTDAQFNRGTNDAVECPARSKIGTVEVESPSLPAGSVGGAVYIGQPTSNDPSSGNQFRIFIHASGPERGVNVRLIGNVFPDLKTGRLTAVIDENPQAPFSSFKIHFLGGPKGTLSTPGDCGPHTVATRLTPWSGTAPATPSGSFTLANYPGGGSCPKTLAERPFAPYFAAGSASTTAAAFSPFQVHVARPDGQQELKGVDVTLPPGLTGKLAGVAYCPESNLAAAAGLSGHTALAQPPCDGRSFLGTASIVAGTGTQPLAIAGNVYLSGPYKGAPLSLAVITPAVAGPYDLGTVVVRVAVFVDPETAQIHAVSDPIPDVYGGVKLDLRSIDINVDRHRFMLNPTHCGGTATTGSLMGGGADPANAAAFSSYAVRMGYQPRGCGKLRFKPKLFTRLYGPTHRNQNPRVRAVLQAREGDANVKRVALTFPHSLFLDQSHIRTVCTRVQLAARNCPKAAVYGHAVAKTPLLDSALRGPVYLVSSDNVLPDLVADLRGQVNIQLHGVISSKRGGIKTVFRTVPDVPVKKFVLNMQGGQKSLLVNSRDLCKSRQSSYLNIGGHNSRRMRVKHLPLKVSACGGKKANGSGGSRTSR
jgi:hypothetical protein